MLRGENREKTNMGESKEKDRTGMVLKSLTREEIEKRGKELAGQVEDREELAEKKRSHNREWNEQLRQIDKVIAQLAEEVDSGQAYVDARLKLPGVDTEPKAAKPNGNGKPAAPAKKAPAKKAAPSKSKAKGKSAGARA